MTLRRFKQSANHIGGGLIHRKRQRQFIIVHCGEASRLHLLYFKARSWLFSAQRQIFSVFIFVKF